MGFGGGGSNAANQSNALMRKQISDQEAEKKRQIQGMYSDELVSLQSQGMMQFEKPGAVIKPTSFAQPSQEAAYKAGQKRANWQKAWKTLWGGL